jgi:hypothetical protein
MVIIRHELYAGFTDSVSRSPLPMPEKRGDGGTAPIHSQPGTRRTVVSGEHNALAVLPLPMIWYPLYKESGWTWENFWVGR